jgi:hypothetical protein
LTAKSSKACGHRVDPREVLPARAQLDLDKKSLSQALMKSHHKSIPGLINATLVEAIVAATHVIIASSASPSPRFALLNITS